MSAEHEVTIEAEGGLISAYRLTCHAPADALCHAAWSCECETLFDPRIRNGVPAHRPDPSDDGTWHAGVFDPAYCNLRDWFEGDDGESLEGKITVPVKAAEEGDYYRFYLVQPW